jgi:hypothetical protein
MGEEIIAFAMEGWGSVSSTNIYTLIVIKSSRSCLFTSVKIVSTVSLRLLCLVSYHYVCTGVMITRYA